MGLSQMGGAILSTDCVDLSSYLKLVLHVRTGSSFQSSQCLCCNGLAHLYVGFRRAAGSSAAAPNRPRSDDSVLHETPETHHLSVSVNHHHQSLNREGRWGATDGFATSFLHFSLFSTALWDLPNSRPVHCLMLSSHLFLCPPFLLSSFTVPYKMVLARPDERET